jgi:methylenetetrahydrofolate dehydrogenase (NADP+) / methenyltetrahydrofolate cyclohydrolase
MPILYSNANLKTALLEFLESKISTLRIKPKLNIVQVSDVTSSTKYINNKKKLAQKIGLDVEHHQFEDTVDEDILLDLIQKSKDNHDGFIFQLPLPSKFNHLVGQTPLECDVDLHSDYNSGLWKAGFLPPTIGAIDLILKEMILRNETGLQNGDANIYEGFNVYDFGKFINSKLDLRGKVVAVIGQGGLVGYPLLTYLRDRDATIISINKDTKNPQSLTKIADIILSGAGVPNLITRDYLAETENQIVIDAATMGVNGALVGDVDTDGMYDNNYLCPSPGGVGPITVMLIFWNLIKLNSKQD